MQGDLSEQMSDSGFSSCLVFASSAVFKSRELTTLNVVSLLKLADVRKIPASLPRRDPVGGMG